MQEITKPNAAHTRVTYQGIIYTICRRCREVIGSGKSEAILLAVEKSHRCLAVIEDPDYEHDRRIYEERSENDSAKVGEYVSELFPENFGLLRQKH